MIDERVPSLVYRAASQHRKQFVSVHFEKNQKEVNLFTIALLFVFSCAIRFFSYLPLYVGVEEAEEATFGRTFLELLRRYRRNLNLL